LARECRGWIKRSGKADRPTAPSSTRGCSNQCASTDTSGPASRCQSVIKATENLHPPTSGCLRFKNIATTPRLTNLKPFDLGQLKAELAKPASASQFIFIAPNQCNDQHGTGSRATDELAQAADDAFLQQTVPAIIASPSFTERSALFIVWDENDYSGNLDCCGNPGVGGGHVPMTVVTKHGKPIKRATPSNHYSLLATIEDGFGLPRLANTKAAATLFDVFPGDQE
jgi:hypothetical protein